MENKQIKFKIDTGAHSNTLTLSDFQKIQHEGELKRSTNLLHTYSNHQIKPVAVAELSLEHNSHLATTTFQIVKPTKKTYYQETPLKHYSYNVISRLASVDMPSPAEFPDLTQTTGTLPGTYTIKLEPNAKGVVHATRHLPVALKERTIHKQWLHSQGTEPTGVGQFHLSFTSRRQSPHLY